MHRHVSGPTQLTPPQTLLTVDHMVNVLHSLFDQFLYWAISTEIGCDEERGRLELRHVSSLKMLPSPSTTFV